MASHVVSCLAAAAAMMALALSTPAVAAPQGEFVPVRGGRLHVVDLSPARGGSGETLLLLHGASGNLKDQQESIGRTLAARHRVILIDRPGHGYSDRLGGREMASPARQADAVAEALEKKGVGRVTVVGHSWSGALATNLALDHPRHVAGLVLLSPATHPYPSDAAWYNQIAATPVIGAIFASIVPAVAESRFEEGVKSTFAPKTAPPDYIERTEAKRLLRASEFVANAEDLVDLKAFLRVQGPRYGAIRVPTTIITADKDDVVSPVIHARPLHAQIAGSKLVVLKDAGHMTHWTETARVVREIEAVAAKGR